MSALEQPVKRVLIAGGGTAGWITAGVLAARYPRRGPEGIEITLLESPARPPIGVGEGTWPTLRTTLQQIGISETDLLRQCDASFKQGSQFNGWMDGDERHGYLHPFTAPAALPGEMLAPHWIEDPPAAFAEAVCYQSAPALQGCAPKLITTPEYAGLANYAYHLDAGKFAGLLKEHCTARLGVRHVLDEIIDVESAEDGDIRRLRTRAGAALEADLYVDCTGLASRLIGQHFGRTLLSRRDVLFVDRAWATQAPHADEAAPIASLTLSTARRAGWIWDIALPHRRGIGHAYASGYLSDEAALEELRDYLRARGLLADTLAFRRLEINPGFREEFWVRNCVAVGLSAGFLEPLEASAIVMVELSAQMIANLLPRARAAMHHAGTVFNRAFRYRWERVVEFLKLHYALSRRDDSDFWRDNRRPGSLPEELAERLAYWRSQCPGQDEFLHREEVFSAASYQYVLYGMGFETAPAPWVLNEHARALAREQLAATSRRARELCAQLPSNRDLLDRIRRFGLQRI